MAAVGAVGGGGRVGGKVSFWRGVAGRGALATVWCVGNGVVRWQRCGALATAWCVGNGARCNARCKAQGCKVQGGARVRRKVQRGTTAQCGATRRKAQGARCKGARARCKVRCKGKHKAQRRKAEQQG